MSVEPNTLRKINWWNAGLWAAQIALALVFGSAGAMKLSQPIDMLAATFNWAAHSPVGLIRFIGFAELAGALGTILPSMTRILPRLTPLAALGFATIQILAIATHASLGESAQTLPLNLALLSLSAIVIFGRTKKAIIISRV